MTRCRAFLIASFAMLLAPGRADTQAAPQIAVETYGRDRVVPLTISLGYATLIELAPEESVEAIVVGDGVTGLVTPTAQGNRVVVKPTTGGVTTDLIITTATRRYVFLLTAVEGTGAGPFVLRFEYPEAARAGGTGIENGRYDLRGAADLFPDTISDDGARTVIMWRAQSPLPAVFALNAAGKEAIVNGRMIGPSYVVEGVSARYVFRRGKKKAVAVRLPVGATR